MKAKIRLLGNLLVSETARNTYAVFIGNAVSAVLAFIFTVTLVRRLTLSDFGYFSALLSFMLLLTELSDIGIGQSLSSFLPRLEKTVSALHSFLKASFVIQLAISSVVSFTIIIFSLTVSRLLFHTDKFAGLVILTAIGIYATVLSNFVNNSLSARKKFLKVAFLTVFGAFLRLALLIVIILFSVVTLNNSVLVQSLSLVILMLAALSVHKFSFLKSPLIKGDIRNLIFFAGFLGLARSFTAIAFRLDVLMLVALKDATEAGIYSTASRVISIYPLLAGSFMMVIAPKIAVLKGNRELIDFSKRVLFATILLVASSIFMIIIARPFMLTLFGDKVIPAVTVFRLLLIAMIFFVASIPPVSIAVYYLRKPYILTVNSVLQLIIVVIGNLILIPVLGRHGPAVSLIIAYGISLLLTTVMTVYHFRLNNPVRLKPLLKK
ncbi:hypothetical protein A3D05_04790 [Candidatus Gottesmanbacteria bacterium RIFCSPHIGHO2_02_FULL_40_24]|uniref:Polysaccharide biosynthesis protein C-terminal domain-containing protein n=1 Tax=Candidatus Gottesmanbacteria bacterium RIFCSPHIGHO2_01_FULL_40_15 TaxID=1798376 RepID=A0A1F5Z1X5_9BACT|nr:MAG: hypothetical protein A2777_05820 [Candidatus Gottesmanbacteria bacterium RIFCSPHIGHO2_01_FULL_40_15]OGG16188.1 MAG: hypothetical protein A3D05_04790 [Candidatus Gottesmanbacteria bacterium RIFCSPHIGHO2_02_FULL_40_24]OGG23186.1 MAG: hypothetical protein A3B48_00165 [Candidatus Gottesmanbacteria bacterium RIFCSPLOWO2_01_FULL_40_10]OGG25857.1 MAG: hypothetical protein A3E42_06060 [Candidatus Gottesmanbacteria bacterium RIFCSPHIGHO2_12_FULL_40_13]OGG33235.1 MAG: hypothetical protein A3I80_0